MNITKVFWSFPRSTAVPVFVGPKTFLMRILCNCSPIWIVRLAGTTLTAPSRKVKGPGGLIRKRGDALHLDAGALGEAGSRDGGTRGRLAREGARVDLVHFREIVHAREEDSRLHDIL